MQLIIDIDPEDYKRICECPEVFNSLTSRAYKAIKYGIAYPVIKCTDSIDWENRHGTGPVEYLRYSNEWISSKGTTNC